MNLYLIQRTDGADWDEYVSAVTAALSPDEARTVTRNTLSRRDRRWGGTPWNAWEPQNARIERIGTYTGRRRQAFVVHSHFHAG